MSTPAIPTKLRGAILQSLASGVVPRVGLQYIQVGRASEVGAIIKALDRVADDGSTFRLVVGEYGSGKTFFLSLLRSIAHEKKLVTVHADLTPDRRLYAASGGRARSLYAELARNMATRAKPDGGALQAVVERFISQVLEDAQRVGINPQLMITERLNDLRELTSGYDFASVVGSYWRGYETGNEALQANAVRWLRGEYSSKIEARQDLGVRSIIDDANYYDMIKLLARFVRLAGFTGLVVCLDEMVNLYKMNHAVTRNSNYEQLLRILNDTLQGSADALGIFLGGTPELLEDTRRGLYSYAALRSRLEGNQFASDGVVDYSGPVLRLSSLTPEELYLLLQRIRGVFLSAPESKVELQDSDLRAFMQRSFNQLGDNYFRTPRQTIKTFVNLLDVLEQNPQLSVASLIGTSTIERERNPDLEPLPEEQQPGFDAGRNSTGLGDTLRSFTL